MRNQVDMAARLATVNAGLLMAGVLGAAAGAANGAGVVLDSAVQSKAVGDYLSSEAAKSGSSISEPTRAVIEEFGAEEIGTAILDSAADYKMKHGFDMPSELLEQALHNAYGHTQVARDEYKLDSASNSAHDPQSLQPNRAVLAILGTVGEACPFAMSLPADIRSNQSKLAILSHHAAAANGSYAANDLLDGINAGRPFLSSIRVHTAMPDVNGELSFKMTAIQQADEKCLQSAPGVKSLRGRGLLFVNGIWAGGENQANPNGTNPVNGRVTLGGVTYTVQGTYNPDTGDAVLATTPKLPTTVPVVFEVPIDFERAPELTAEVTTMVQTYDIYANPWRGKTRVSPDARTQMANELGLDPYSESVVAIQNQYAIERHYRALALVRRAAANNVGTYNFEWTDRSQQMQRSAIWQDFSPELGLRSQQMVEDTMDHGITHLYVGKDIKAQWEGLGSDLFTPSGVQERPGIYRFGRLYNKYECYYTPRGVKETETSAEILAVGRATNPARNPVVFGDAVSPTVIPLAVGDDLRHGAGYYARDYTVTNPHLPSAMGAALITVTGLRQ